MKANMETLVCRDCACRIAGEPLKCDVYKLCKPDSVLFASARLRGEDACFAYRRINSERS